MAIPALQSAAFSLLSQELRDYLSEIGEVVVYDENALILDYGMEADFMPIILDGSARVMRIDDDDPSKELLLYFLTPGEICPCAAFSLLPNGIMPITVEAESTCEVLHVPISALGGIVEKHSEWGLF